MQRENDEVKASVERKRPLCVRSKGRDWERKMYKNEKKRLETFRYQNKMEINEKFRKMNMNVNMNTKRRVGKPKE